MSWIKLNFRSFLLSFLILLIAIFHIGLPLYADLMVSFTIAIILRNWLASLITSIALLSSFIVINFVFEQQIHYRAHEMLAGSQGKYLPNQDIKIVQPYGDLFAIGLQELIMFTPDNALSAIIEPRKIRFVTDKNGYRNRAFQNNPDYILIGDSFVVGNGTTQDETLSEQIANKLDQKIYSLSHPGSPQQYEQYLGNSPFLSDENKNILLFYFEGNDFAEENNLSATFSTNDFNVGHFLKTFVSQLEHYKLLYLNKIYPKKFKLVRIINRKGRLSYLQIYAFIKGLSDAGATKITPKVVVESIGDSKVGFLKTYNDKSLSKSLNTYIWTNKDLLKKIKYVVFIPTKYRVYHELEENIALKTLIKGYEGTAIPVIDLTSTLREVAKRYLSTNRFVFWRDDTHWNGLGISAAAELLADLLRNDSREELSR